MPGAGLCFALGVSLRGCAILQQASSTHVTISAAVIRTPSNGASSESRAELTAHALLAGGRHVNVHWLLLCSARGAAPHAAGVAHEALLHMPLAVATKRAAQAHEVWGYAAPQGGSLRGQEDALLESTKRER